MEREKTVDEKLYVEIEKYEIKTCLQTIIKYDILTVEKFGACFKTTLKDDADIINEAIALAKEIAKRENIKSIKMPIEELEKFKYI